MKKERVTAKREKKKKRECVFFLNKGKRGS